MDPVANRQHSETGLPRRDTRGAIAVSLLCLAIGAYCILFPETILDDPHYAKLPKRSFGAALGLVFVGFAIASYAHTVWREKRYPGAAFAGRTIGSLLFLSAFAYMFKCIVETSGWPW